MLLRPTRNCYWIACIIFFQLQAELHTIKTTSGQAAMKTRQIQSKLSKPSLKLGLENVQDPLWQKLKNNNKKIRIGLITNHTGKDQQDRRSIDILLARGLAIARIFVPEHGLNGSLRAAQEVKDTIDTKTHIPVVSLYGHGTGKKIPANKLKDIDMLIFDMQDSGMRHYTYISTLFYVVQAAGEHNKPIIILDRPNPLGACMEGPLVDSTLRSFISVASIPLRHGMTLGELARYFNVHVLTKKAELYVISMLNYDRTLGLTIPYTALSPNLPNKASCYGYSLLGLLGEIRPVYTGTGTDLAMQCVALAQSNQIKDKEWNQLHGELKKYGIESEWCDYLTPTKKYHCHGLKLIMPHINKVAAFQGLLTILKFFHDCQVHLDFSAQFNLAVGTKRVQDYINGKLTHAQLMNGINEQLEGFYKIAQSSFIYKPWPQLQIQKKSL